MVDINNNVAVDQRIRELETLKNEVSIRESKKQQIIGQLSTFGIVVNDGFDIEKCLSDLISDITKNENEITDELERYASLSLTQQFKGVIK